MLTTVEYHAPSGITTMAKTISARQRQIDKMRKTWPMDRSSAGSDYRAWAEKDMASLLLHMAANLTCRVSDPEIG